MHEWQGKVSLALSEGHMQVDLLWRPASGVFPPLTQGKTHGSLVGVSTLVTRKVLNL